MPVCEIATEVGQTYRWEWEQVDSEGRFGLTGTLLSMLKTFADAEARDAALDTGMTDGMESAYARLESLRN